MNKRESKLFYGWVIVAVATLALVVSNGLSIGGIPVFYKPMREDLVAAGTVAAANAESFVAFGATLTFFFSGVLSPVAGWLIQRFRLKTLMVAGCVLLGGALVTHALTSSPYVVYTARAVMGVSLCLVGVLPSIVLVSNWFVRRRGLALGILLTGTSIGGVVIPQIATPLITSYGWRTAMVAVSMLVWVLLLPTVLLLVKDRPEEVGALPDGDPVAAATSAPTAATGLTLAQALRTPLFWTLALCAAAVFYPIFVSTQQFILQAAKIGLSPQQASFGLSSLFFSRPKSRFFNPAHLRKAHEFYEKHGGKTIIIARFVPIVRTFAPIVAGAADMSYRQFAIFNIVGGFAWVTSMLFAGYFLGGLVEQAVRNFFGIEGFLLEDHIDKVVIVVVLLSILPIIFEYVKARREKKAEAIAEAMKGKTEVSGSV